MALTHVEVDLSKIKQNIKNLKYLIRPETKTMVVVKSNAYGHGIIQVAKTAIEAGANWLGVVNIGEGLRLREAGTRVPILVLGYPGFSQIQHAAQKGIAIPILSIEQAERLASYKLSYPLVVHLKVETGINRLGLQKNEIIKAYNLLKLNKQIVIEGLYSHFASVEEENINYSQKQIKNFGEVLKELKKKKINIPLKHFSATSAVMILSEAQYDMVRLGIGVYGLWPSEGVKKTFLKSKNADENFLQPALSYKTQIVQLKDVKRGDVIGYGCTYRAKKNMTIAVLPVGYYEGIDRLLSNPSPLGKNYKGGEVLIKGQRCQIIGRVCMNMIIADVSKLSKISVGDEVVIIGKQTVTTPVRSGPRSESIGADEIAKKIKTINYEIVSRIPEHITRIYKL